MGFFKPKSKRELQKSIVSLKAKKELQDLRKEEFRLKHGKKVAFAKRVGSSSARGTGTFLKKHVLPVSPKRHSGRPVRPLNMGDIF